jgi:hypothetical protein
VGAQKLREGVLRNSLETDSWISMNPEIFMRTLQKKPKVLTPVEIPPDLRAFLKEVAELIEVGDEATTIESDDLIQCEFAHGGLCEEGIDEFGFTYFPGKGIKTHWDFVLSAAQINEVAAGNTTTLELWECTDTNCDSMFPNSDWACGKCDYIDDDPPKLPTGEFRSRRDWGLAYFALNPDAHPLEMIGAYNGNEQRDDSLGFFSLEEAREIQSAFQSGEKNEP